MKNLILTLVFAIITLITFSQIPTPTQNSYVDVVTTIDNLNIDTTYNSTGNITTSPYNMCYNNNIIYLLDTDTSITIHSYMNTGGVTSELGTAVVLSHVPFIRETAILGVSTYSNYDTILNPSASNLYGSSFNITHDSLINVDTIFVYLKGLVSGGVPQVFTHSWFKIVKVTQEQWNDIQLGINDLELTTTRLSAYPNPASSNITIDFDVTTNEVPVAIFSMSGQLVYSNDDNRNNGTNSLNVDVSGFQTGIYIVKAGSKYYKLIKK